MCPDGVGGNESRFAVFGLDGFDPCLAAFLVATPLLAADDPRSEEFNKEMKDGFVSLFNGKDLTGWIYGKVKTKDGEKDNKAGDGYQVKDGGPVYGVIYCTKADGGNLYTEKEYANFVLRFEFKLSESANNGIGIRAPLTGDSAYQGMADLPRSRGLKLVYP